MKPSPSESSIAALLMPLRAAMAVCAAAATTRGLRPAYSLVRISQTQGVVSLAAGRDGLFVEAAVDGTQEPSLTIFPGLPDFCLSADRFGEILAVAVGVDRWTIAPVSGGSCVALDGGGGRLHYELPTTAAAEFPDPISNIRRNASYADLAVDGGALRDAFKSASFCVAKPGGGPSRYVYEGVRMRLEEKTPQLTVGSAEGGRAVRATVLGEWVQVGLTPGAWRPDPKGVGRGSDGGYDEEGFRTAVLSAEGARFLASHLQDGPTWVRLFDAHVMVSQGPIDFTCGVVVGTPPPIEAAIDACEEAIRFEAPPSAVRQTVELALLAEPAAEAEGTLRLLVDGPHGNLVAFPVRRPRSSIRMPISPDWGDVDGIQNPPQEEAPTVRMDLCGKRLLEALARCDAVDGTVHVSLHPDSPVRLTADAGRWVYLQSRVDVTPPAEPPPEAKKKARAKG